MAEINFDQIFGSLPDAAAAGAAIGANPGSMPLGNKAAAISITPVGDTSQPHQPVASASTASASPNFDAIFSALPDKAAPTPGLLDRVGQFAGGVASGVANAANLIGQGANLEMGPDAFATVASQAANGQSPAGVATSPGNVPQFPVPSAATIKAGIENNLTGPLPTPAPNDTLGQYLQTIGSFVGNPLSYLGPGSIPAKIGIAALSGLGSETGGQLAQGTPYEPAARFAGALIGGGAAAKIAQPFAVTEGIGPAPSAAAPSVEDLEAAYKAVRTNPDVKNAVIPIQDVKDLATTAEGQLLADGYRPTPKSAPGTFAEINRLTPSAPPEPTPLQKLQAEMNWERLPQQPQVTQATVDDLLAAKRSFRNIANERNPFPDMKPTVDASAAGKVIPQLDALIEEAAPGMKEANANYAKAQAARTLDKRFQKAEDSAGTANSGLNVGNKIRQAALAAYYNPNATRGLKPQELQMLKQVADGNFTRNSLRYVSNLLGGGGGLGAVVTGEIASHSLGPVGWLLSPIGHALKHLENHLTLSAANKISEAIRGSSPLGQAIQSSAEKWNAARDAFVRGPNSAKFAALSIASRNFSNNLAGAGVKIHPTQLLGSVQGPVDARAKDKQQ